MYRVPLLLINNEKLNFDEKNLTKNVFDETFFDETFFDETIFDEKYLTKQIWRKIFDELSAPQLNKSPLSLFRISDLAAQIPFVC